MNPAQHAVVDTVAMKTASAATYGGGGMAFWYGINSSWAAAIGGIAIGVAGLLVNIYFKHQHLKLARQRAGLIGEDE